MRPATESLKLFLIPLPFWTIIYRRRFLGKSGGVQKFTLIPLSNVLGEKIMTHILSCPRIFLHLVSIFSKLNWRPFLNVINPMSSCPRIAPVPKTKVTGDRRQSLRLTTDIIVPQTKNKNKSYDMVRVPVNVARQ